MNPRCPRCNRLAAISDKDDEIYCFTCGYVHVGEVDRSEQPRKRPRGKTSGESKLQRLPPIENSRPHRIRGYHIASEEEMVANRGIVIIGGIPHVDESAFPS